MTQAYSLDLRQRAVALVAGGQSRRAVARLLRLGESSVIGWTQRQASTGDCAAKPRGGKRPVLLLDQRDWLLARITTVPDLTVRALRAELAERGARVSPDTVWRFLRQERLTFKKACTPPNKPGLTSLASARAGNDTTGGSPPRAGCWWPRRGARPT